MEEKLPNELEEVTNEPEPAITEKTDNEPEVDKKIENTKIIRCDYTQRAGIHILEENEVALGNDYNRDKFVNEIKSLNAKKRFAGAFTPSILFFVLATLVPLIIAPLFSNNENTVMNNLYMMIIMYLLIHIINILISRGIFKMKLFDPITNHPKKPKKAFLTIIVAIGIGLLVQIAVQPIYEIVPSPMEETGFFATPQSTLLYFVILALIPAIFEEWLLRGFVLKHLLPLGKWTAIIVSSALFGLMHAHPAQAIFAFAIGIMLGIVYVNSGGNIWLTFIIHFLNNSFSVVQGYIYENYGMESSQMTYVSIAQYVIISVALLVLLYYTFKGKRAFFLPEDDSNEVSEETEILEDKYDSYDKKPREAARLIFKNIRTYVVIILSILNMLVNYMYTINPVS